MSSADYDSRAVIALLYAIVRGTNADAAITWAGGLKSPPQREVSYNNKPHGRTA